MAELCTKKKNAVYNAILTGLVLILTITISIAQTPASINIDQLSDEQLIQYMNTAHLTGLSDAELETKARQNGWSDNQISKLKDRVAKLTQSGTSKLGNQDIQTKRIYNASPNAPNNAADAAQSNELQIYGSELFNNTNLTFEPNLKIATPRNYIIGVEDQLHIDIFGYAEASYNLTVSPEGAIRIPNVGPVKVAGLTFDDAQKKIKEQLSKIYSGIAAGNTSMQVSLGQIRSIRVTLIGEIVKPGTYTLPSLATIANALYVSGGPNKNGSFRNIQLIRNGKTKAIFDLYDFLTRGDLGNNLILEDDDIIRVAPYSIHITLEGAVKHPAIFEAKSGESLNDMVNYAGGFSDNAYKETIRITRQGKREKEVLTVAFNNIKNFMPQSGDVAIVDNITDRFRNRISITGDVFHPGNYSLTTISDLKTLLQQAGVKESAFRDRAIINRLQENYIPEIVSFNINDILSGKTNIALQREDAVIINSIESLREKYTVQINGEVNKPGTYQYADNIKLQDLLLVAGGFKDAASKMKIEVSRRIRNSGTGKDTSTYAVIQEVSVDDDLSQAKDFTLQPFDIVSVRKDPAYTDQIMVSIEGEVLYPGQYSISRRNERLSDLIARAGGLRQSAYPEGAILFRKTYENTSDDSSKRTLLNIIQKQSSSDTADKEEARASLREMQKPVGIKLDEVIQNPNSPYNIMLVEGDVLQIPNKLETVQTTGGIYVSQKIVYRAGIGFKDVIRASGGYTQNAIKRKSYVVYPNGEIMATHTSFIFFKKYPEIKPGAQVYVPVRTKSKGMSVQEILGYTSALLGIVGVTIAIIKM
ncbi:MAG: SLBB domain-containing protein [Chitinophagaceae bacterium]|jgi:protein involved in polysaccharide export with SLBB domain|nr:SLBB domain-containing protein [Chitinophagaceae bacterium]